MEQDQMWVEVDNTHFHSNIRICIADIKKPQDFTRNLFLERKALPKEHIRFSFSTGFLFVKKKKCCVISWL
jgi:hypothetical protein